MYVWMCVYEYEYVYVYEYVHEYEYVYEYKYGYRVRSNILGTLFHRIVVNSWKYNHEHLAA